MGLRLAGQQTLALSMAAPFTDSVPLSGGQALGHELDQLLPSRPVFIVITPVKKRRSGDPGPGPRTELGPARSSTRSSSTNSIALRVPERRLERLRYHPTHSAARCNRQLLSQRPARRRRPPTTWRHGCVRPTSPVRCPPRSQRCRHSPCLMKRLQGHVEQHRRGARMVVSAHSWGKEAARTESAHPARRLRGPQPHPQR